MCGKQEEHGMEVDMENEEKEKADRQLIELSAALSAYHSNFKGADGLTLTIAGDLFGETHGNSGVT